MQEGWDKPLWIAKLLKQNKQDIMDKLDSIENIFKKAGDATATDSDIVKPKTAYNGNTLLTGTLEDKTGTTSYTANTTLDSTNKLLRMQVPSVGKYGVENYLQQSFATIANLIGLTSAKLLKNNTVLGITGNSSNMDTSSCNAAAAQILSGKKAGVKGNTVTGTMANKAGTTVKASAISQDEDNTYFTIPASGFYDTSSKIYTENSNLTNFIEAKVLYNGAGGNINLTIPGEFKNGTLIIQASHDNRQSFSCSISGKTPVYSYHGNNYLQSYFNMDVDIFQLNGDTSITLAMTCAGCTVTVIDKKVTPTYVSTGTSLNASEGEDYLCIYTRDYRNYMLVTADGVSCSNLRSAFSSAEALYGVYGTWYCHNCATICAMKDTTVAIAGDLVLWLKV